MAQTSDRTPLLARQSSRDDSQSTEHVGVLESTKPETNHHNLAGFSAWDFRIICVSVWSCTFLSALDGTIVATLISDIGSDFHASNLAAWLGTSYLLSVCCFTPIYGRLCDLIGRRGAMLTALSFFGIGTVCCGLAPSMQSLIAARAIAGVGGGGLASVSSIIFSDLVSLQYRGLFQGYANIAFGLGAGLGGPVGGWIADTFGWRIAFLFQVPFLFFSGVMIYLKVRLVHKPTSAPGSGSATPLPTSSVETVQPSVWTTLRRIDSLGSLLLVTTVGSLLLALSFKTASTDAQELAWSDPQVWSLLATSAVGFILFIFVEGWVAPEPVLPLRLLKRRTPVAVAISNFSISVSTFSVLYNMPMYLSAVKLSSASYAGAHLIPNSVLLSLGSVLAGYVMRRTGKYYYLGIAFGLCNLTSTLMLISWHKTSGNIMFWISQGPGGFGFAGILTSTLVALIGSVEREEIAVATGLSYLFRTTGQVLGVSLSAAIVQAVLKRELTQRITGNGSAEVIALIRRSTSSIAHLPRAQQVAATDSYHIAIHTVFIFDFVCSLVGVLAMFGIKEEPMPDVASQIKDVSDDA